MDPLTAVARALGILEEAMYQPPPDLPGGRWCDACGIRTNHGTVEHLDAEADAPREG